MSEFKIRIVGGDKIWTKEEYQIVLKTSVELAEKLNIPNGVLVQNFVIDEGNMKKLSNLELLMEYMEQNQYFIGNDLLVKYNELLQKESKTSYSFRHSYLVKFVDPSKTYTVVSDITVRP